jgi:diaminohydroxyphosphoribosylaminopyrimidine deaminase/5-amino-6-(5-phosphoribosylamino)uracil reductase
MSDLQAERWMRRALELAERGRGYVEPNPLVGAVLVRDDTIVGEGWHQRFGEAHAEINALAAAGKRARGATLYITLEPCCHVGKTPPCTDALIAAGIERVVAALRDPFPQVAGQGAARLQAAGIAVDMGTCEAEARRLNAPYLTLLASGRPCVHAKWAMTLDGKIATRTGDSKWISGEASRRKVHELRGRMDAIVIGIGTALVDDPLLTARPPGPRTATRIVLDSQARLPLTSRLVQTAHDTPLLIVTGPGAPGAAALATAGAQLLVIPSAAERRRLDVCALLQELGRQRLTNILVEGGSELLGSFRDAGMIDEVHVFAAPLLAGGAAAKSPVGGAGIERIGDALRLAEWQVERIDNDLYIHGWR